MDQTSTNINIEKIQHVQRKQQVQYESKELKKNDESFANDVSDIRIAVIGNVDSGKSTLIGVLISGILDNGRGLARKRMFVHQHELSSGRTSAISQHIMGYKKDHTPVHNSASHKQNAVAKTKAWTKIVEESESIITFVDLAGHERYLKTTIAGLTGCFPDYAMVIINSLAGVQKMTKEHFGVAIALRIPLCCVVTKIDMCPPNILDQTKKKLKKILKSTAAGRKKTITIRGTKDVHTCLSNISSIQICPIFFISCVTGENLELLQYFLARMKGIRNWDSTSENLTEIHIDQTFNVPGVGLVISGIVSSGIISINQELVIGPMHNQTFRPILIKSLHCKRNAVKECKAGVSCTFSVRALKWKEPLIRSSIRPGMVVVDKRINPVAHWEFDSEVLVLHHPTTIKKGYHTVIHCGIIRQTAEILFIKKIKCSSVMTSPYTFKKENENDNNVEEEYIRTGDKALVRFKFKIRAEYMHVGTNFIFREGNTKGIGKITQLYQMAYK